MSTQLQPKSPTRTLKYRYILALSAVALLSIAGQVGIQLSMKHQFSDAVVINVAGRQRMLSQKLTKASLAIQSSTNATITERYMKELQDVVDLWEKSHRGLQLGDSSLGLPGDNSARIKQLFANIERSHQTMLDGANQILTAAKNKPNSPANYADFAQYIGQILGQETHFLQGMDAIVAQYQREAENRVLAASQIEWLLLTIVLLVLLLEAMLIFHPTVLQLETYISELRVQKSKAAELSAQLEEQNVQLEMNLEEAYSSTRMKSEFLANVSHELLTPMNAAMGMTTLLLQTGLTPQQQDFVQTIHQSGENLLQLIQNILDFSKIEAGQLQLDNAPLDLRQCIEDALDVVAADAAKKDLDLAYEIDGQTVTQLLGDRSRLQQILVNLLENAVKFTDRGEIFVSVTAEDLGTWSIGGDRDRALSSAQQYQEIQFCVRDTGIGIPQHQLNRLFRSFSPGDASNVREYGGLGLGLAITKRLIELMSGRLWVESNEGVGSTFSFSMTTVVLPNAADPLSEVQPALQGKRLLIVDDRGLARQMIRQQAETWGMTCVDVATGTEALQCIQQGNQFDVALLDTQMPQMDGLSLAQLIHQEQYLPGLKLVMMNAIACPIKLPDRDFVACLKKPIKVSQLYETILDLLAPSPAKQQAKKSQSQTPEILADRLPLRILLAEDNMVNQKVALRLLKRLGYKADVAKNGLEAIAALEQKPYDLVLMDIQMPKMDGLEATRRICQQWGEDISDDYATQKKPSIIAITAGGTDGDRAKCLAAGMDDYLTKPINIELLKRALEQLGERSSWQHLTSEPSETGLDRKHSVGIKEGSAAKPDGAIAKNGSNPHITTDNPITLDATVLENLRQELSASEDMDLVQEIIDLFLAHTPSLLADIKTALEAQNHTALKYALHTLKGSTSNLGLRKMSYFCQKLQELGDIGLFEEATTLFSELDAEFVRVQAMFKSEVS